MDVIRPRKVFREHSSEDALNQDLERYRQEAVKYKGISEVAVIDQEDIIVDIRVPLKCSIPKCYSYGTSIHCPPLIDISAEKMKQVAKMFSHGILMKADIPSDLVAGEELTKAILSHQRDPEKKWSSWDGR